jgi:hypothetical protein
MEMLKKTVTAAIKSLRSILMRFVIRMKEPSSHIEGLRLTGYVMREKESCLVLTFQIRLERDSRTTQTGATPSSHKIFQLPSGTPPRRARAWPVVQQAAQAAVSLLVFPSR